jgi:hypothetical protein
MTKIATNFLALATRLRAEQQRYQCSIPARAKYLFLHQCSDRLWSYANLFSMPTGSPFHGAKLPGHVANPPPPSSAKVKNARSYTSSSLYIFRCDALRRMKMRDPKVQKCASKLCALPLGFAPVQFLPLLPLLLLLLLLIITAADRARIIIIATLMTLISS